METLLTPSESQAFQSFLTNAEASHLPSDWATYSSHFDPRSFRTTNHDDYAEPPIQGNTLPSAPHESDPLTKATKDLMSLDDGAWGEQAMVMDHPQAQQQQYFNRMGHIHHEHQLHPPPQSLQYPASQQDAYSFLNSKPHLHQQHSYMPNQMRQSFGFPNQGFHGSQLGSMNGSYTESRSLPPSHAPPARHPRLPHEGSESPIPSSSAAPRRPTRAASAASAGSSSTKRTAVAQSHSSSSASPRPSGGNGQSNKPALLSPSQKKANHIQSEQKRRANIRRGYEALCETVPALREAIREEEEEAKAAALAAAAGITNGKSKSSKKRSGKKKDGEESARDKIDGRAGPRSENVVLSKTIDYINDLLADRAALLARLQRGRAMLPPGHPATIPLTPNPLWEREWKGGEGKEGNEAEEGEDSDEGDGAEGSDDTETQFSGNKAKTRKKGKNSGS